MICAVPVGSASSVNTETGRVTLSPGCFVTISRLFFCTATPISAVCFRLFSAGVFQESTAPRMFFNNPESNR